MSTIDLDLLIKNLRLPRTARNLVAIAEENGFIYDEDTLYGTSKFFGKDQFEVEFLISQLGNGSEKLPRTKLGVNAQQLTHVSMLKDNSMTKELAQKKRVKSFLNQSLGTVTHKSERDYDRNKEKAKLRKEVVDGEE